MTLPPSSAIRPIGSWHAQRGDGGEIVNIRLGDLAPAKFIFSPVAFTGIMGNVGKAKVILNTKI